MTPKLKDTSYDNVFIFLLLICCDFFMQSFAIWEFGSDNSPRCLDARLRANRKLSGNLTCLLQ